MISGWTPINQPSSSPNSTNTTYSHTFEASKDSFEEDWQPSREITDEDRRPCQGTDHIDLVQKTIHLGSGSERSKPSQSGRNLNSAVRRIKSTSKRKAHKHTDVAQDLPRIKPKRQADFKDNVSVTRKRSIHEITEILPAITTTFDTKQQADSQSGKFAFAAVSAVSITDSRYTPFVDVDQTGTSSLGEDYEPPQSAPKIACTESTLFGEPSDDLVVLDSTPVPAQSVDVTLPEVIPTTLDFGQASQATEQSMQLLAEQVDLENFYDNPEGHELSDELFKDFDMEEDLLDWLEPSRTVMTDICSSENGNTVQAHRKGTEVSSPLRSQSSILNDISPNVQRAGSSRATKDDGSENEYSDVDLETSLIDLTASDKNGTGTPATSPLDPTTPKLQWLPPKPAALAKFPDRATTPDIPHKIQFNSKGEPIPFLRSPFPALARDRSPILGLSNRTALRTCFRIGEALNAACHAARNNIDAVVELYARVIDSSREGYKQYIIFADLFTENPPYLMGTYGMWKGVGLWDQDSAAFIGEEGKGKMCRVLGRIKKEKGQACEMTVLSVWECGWEDVGIAKGIAIS